MRARCVSAVRRNAARAAVEDTGFDVVEHDKPTHAFGGVDLGVAAVADFAEAVPDVGPGSAQAVAAHRLAVRSGLPAATGAAIGLQDAVEALQELFGMFTAGAGRRFGTQCQAVGADDPEDRVQTGIAVSRQRLVEAFAGTGRRRARLATCCQLERRLPADTISLLASPASVS